MSEPQEDQPVRLSRASVTRRTALGLGVTGVAVAAAAVDVRHVRDQPSKATPGAEPAPIGARDPFEPVYRFRLRDSVEQWVKADNSNAAVSHDSDGWLVAKSSGRVAFESPSSSPETPLDWSLTDRPNDDRLSLSMLIHGPAETYPVTVTMSWWDGGQAQEATSAVFDIPTYIALDLDTWWDCRGTAPTDVLHLVRGVRINAEGGDDVIAVRVRDVRQPPSTAPHGLPATGLAAVFAVAPAAIAKPVVPVDVYQAAVLDKLNVVHDWSVTNSRAIHIGEWAWPKEADSSPPGGSPSDKKFAELADQWMSLADGLAIPYTPWGESAYWGGNASLNAVDYGSYPDANYFCGVLAGSDGLPAAVSQVKPAAKILEQHHNQVPGIPPSINLVGMCFTFLQDGSEFSVTNTGQRGRDYFSENPKTVSYLHDRGYRIFRVPFRWDRIMRLPDDPHLDEDEWGYVQDAIEVVLALPDTAVIVDVHCSGEFWISQDPADLNLPAVRHTIDGPTKRVTTEMFVDLWMLLSKRLGKHSDRLIYELTNEPRDTSPLVVKKYTQAVVSALRAQGDTTFCLIPSYPYDSINKAFAEENQPFPWIEDRAGTAQHAYTLHQYMDLDQSGNYDLTYDETLATYKAQS